jgi:putative inorganic carbon (hco3(-)) transporter
MPIRDTLVALILLYSLPKVFFRPHIGVYLWSWIGYMNPHRLGWGFMYNYPIAQVIGLVTLGSFAFSSERKRLPGNAVVVVWIFFILWMCITTLFAYHPNAAKFQLEKVIKIQLFIALTFMMINNKERIQMLVWVIALSVGFFGIKGGVFTVLTGGAFRVWGPPGSFIEGNNEIGLATIMILPLLNYLRLTTDKKWIKLFLIFSIGSCAFSIVGTQSRGAFLAGGAMVFFLWLKSRKKALSGILMVLAVAVILSMMPQKFFDRMSTIQEYDEDASAMGRINAWYFAYNLASENLCGGGFETFSNDLFLEYAPNPTDVHDAHSIYFEVMGEHGFIGLILFLSVGLLSLNNSVYIIRHTKAKPELDWANELAKMLQVSLVGYAAGGAFLGMAYFDLPYHLMALLVLTREIVEKETQQSQTT